MILKYNKILLLSRTYFSPLLLRVNLNLENQQIQVQIKLLFLKAENICYLFKAADDKILRDGVHWPNRDCANCASLPKPNNQSWFGQLFSFGLM
jgi:hypothetical protein